MCNNMCTHEIITQVYPPIQCRHCKETGPIFFEDTERTTTYRCRLCGTEHYDIGSVVGNNQRDPHIQGTRV